MGADGENKSSNTPLWVVNGPTERPGSEIQVTAQGAIELGLLLAKCAVHHCWRGFGGHLTHIFPNVIFCIDKLFVGFWAHFVRLTT